MAYSKRLEVLEYFGACLIEIQQLTQIYHSEQTTPQFGSKFKYPAENHPTDQYEQGFKYLHAEGLKGPWMLFREMIC
jgi:hypothetical protein